MITYIYKFECLIRNSIDRILNDGLMNDGHFTSIQGTMELTAFYIIIL